MRMRTVSCSNSQVVLRPICWKTAGDLGECSPRGSRKQEDTEKRLWVSRRVFHLRGKKSTDPIAYAADEEEIETGLCEELFKIGATKEHF